MKEYKKKYSYNMNNLTLIMTAYNAENSIYTALSSLKYSLNKGMSLIIVDDGSDDETIDIINDFSKKNNYFRKIRLIENEINKGVGISKNKGIQSAETKYIAFMDSDDWISYDYYELLYEYISKNKLDFVRCGATQVINKDRNKNVPPLCDFYKTLPIDKYIGNEHVSSMMDFPWLQFGMYDREYLSSNNILCDNTRSAEDRLFFWKLLLSDPIFHILPFYGYFYDKTPNMNSLTQTLEESRFDFTKTYLNIINYVRGFGNKIYTNKAIRQFIALLEFHSNVIKNASSSIKEKYYINAKNILYSLTQSEFENAYKNSSKERKNLIDNIMGR